MDWSKLLSLPGPTATAAFLASCGISWGYAHKFGLLQNIPANYVIWANIGVFVFGAIALVWLVTLFIRWVSATWHGFQFKREMSDLLDTLAPDEEELLYAMVGANQRSITLSLLDPRATRLKQKQMLVPGTGTGNAAKWPFAIPTEVWRELKRRYAAQHGRGNS